jgi:autotransporter strand-loop-strand O-heptosyltransferase
MTKVKYNYKTTLPKEANAPSVFIDGDSFVTYRVTFNIIEDNEIKKIKEVDCRGGETVQVNYTQAYKNWYITVYSNGKLISQDIFNPYKKIVFIKIDGRALGDNLAWFPYVEEFRKKWDCTVICSTFFNDLFKNLYPEILFVLPNTNIDNVYAQYYIGSAKDDNEKYSPVNYEKKPLQSCAYEVLDLEPKEIKTELENVVPKAIFKQKTVCISEFASSDIKMWKEENGWQRVVDFLVSIGYQVLAISKEKTNLNNVIDLTGDFPLIERCLVIKNSDFFIGVSSGLSWLSWSLGKHTFLISDVTPKEHEFQSNVTRICANPRLNEINYEPINITSAEEVIENIKKYLNH